LPHSGHDPAILNNSLSNVPTRLNPIFNLHVPVSCEGIPPEILDPETPEESMTTTGRAGLRPNSAELEKLQQTFLKRFGRQAQGRIKSNIIFIGLTVRLKMSVHVSTSNHYFWPSQSVD
jgi:ATP-dependent phosphoenolpyruvate carboxykinase